MGCLTPETGDHQQSRDLIERGPLFTSQTHATSSPGGGLNTQTVTEYDIITVESITNKLPKSTDKLNRPENDVRLASLV